MKRALLIALSLILAFTMFSCGDTSVSTSSENTVQTNENGTLDLKNNRFSVYRDPSGSLRPLPPWAPVISNARIPG